MSKYLFDILYVDCSHVFITKENNVYAEKFGKLNKLHIILNVIPLPA